MDGVQIRNANVYFLILYYSQDRELAHVLLLTLQHSEMNNYRKSHHVHSKEQDNPNILRLHQNNKLYHSSAFLQNVVLDATHRFTSYTALRSITIHTRISRNAKSS